MLRQFAFACCEHVSLEELTGGLMSRLALRRRQLAKSRLFLRGEGLVPSVRGVERSAAFDEVARVQPADQDAPNVEDLLSRYAVARVAGRSVCGEGYYGWPVVPGLGALCASIAAIGWVARYRAAAGGRSRVVFDDVARAVGIVDRAATRVPILGRVSERARISYLMDNDGLARLLAGHVMTEQKDA
jgi:hypothetical protein